MDVRCTKCGVEYEFDEDRVSPAGVTVKCTSCGHVFKVKPGGAEPDAPVDDAGRADGWMVRHKDGTVLRFKELTTLQKWIVEQKVGRDDEISKTGKSWKHLGEIAELSSFFQVVDAANTARQQPQAQPLPSAERGDTPWPLSPAPGGPVGLAPGAVPNASHPGLVMPAPRPQAPAPIPAPAPLAAPPPAPAMASPQPAEGGFFGGDKTNFDDLDDEDPVLAWKRRGRAKKAAAALLVLVVGGTAGLYFFARPTFDRIFAPVLALVKEPGPDPVDVRAAELAKALPKDAAAALDAAIAELSPVATDAQPVALSVLARLHAARAHLAKERARLASLAGEAGKDEASAQEQSHGEHLAKAYELASRARAKAPASPDADLAFAAYQATKGALAEMATDLESARAHGPDRADVAQEADAIAALAAFVAATSGDEASRAKAAAELDRALQGAPGDVRLQYAKQALAALVATSKEPADAAALERARTGLERLLEQAPAHERAQALLASLPKPEGTPAEPTGGDPATDKAAADPAAATGDEDKADGKGDAKSGPASYDDLVKKADRLRMRDRAGAALSLYKKAADLRPSSPRAFVGMGWCYIDLGKFSRAADAFRKAIDADPGYPVAHFGLAESLRFGGQKAKAVRSYERYLELDPAGQDAPVARNALEALK